MESMLRNTLKKIEKVSRREVCGRGKAASEGAQNNAPYPHLVQRPARVSGGAQSFSGGGWSPLSRRAQQSAEDVGEQD